MLFLGASTGEWLQECYPSALGILVLGWRDDSPGLPLLLSCLGVATLYICHAKRWRKRSELRRFVQFPAPFSSLFDTCGAPGRLSPRLASRPNLSQEYPLSRAKYILALPVKIYNEAIVYMIVQPKPVQCVHFWLTTWGWKSSLPDSKLASNSYPCQIWQI